MVTFPARRNLTCSVNNLYSFIFPFPRKGEGYLASYLFSLAQVLGCGVRVCRSLLGTEDLRSYPS